MNRQIEDDALYNDEIEDEAELKIENDWLWAILCASLGYVWCLMFCILVIVAIIVLIKVGITLWNSIIL